MKIVQCQGVKIENYRGFQKQTVVGFARLMSVLLIWRPFPSCSLEKAPGPDACRDRTR